MTLCVSRTPHRLSLIGGGTDVKEYYCQYGGISINFSINMFSSCMIEDNPYGGIIIKSKDLGSIFSSPNTDPHTIYGEPFNLVRAVYEKILKITGKSGLSFSMETDSVVPVGSGLGGSSSMITSILSAFLAFIGKEVSKDELRNLAYEIEREDLGIKGGVQDHLCAAYGGFNVYYLNNTGIEIQPLEVKSLTDGLVLVYTGISRDGSETMNQQINKVKSGSKEKIDSLNKIKENAITFLGLIKNQNYEEIHQIINHSWIHKIENMESTKKKIILDIYHYGLKMGAFSGRILGAGNGGFMIFFSDNDKKIDIGSAIALKFPQSRVFYPIFEKEGSKII